MKRIARRAAELVAFSLLLVVLTACGKATSPPNAATVTTATTEAQREAAALPLGQAAPIPGSLHCRDAVVWVNLSSKAYHEPADPYYGRTRHGEYMCISAAIAQGFHAAGARHVRKARHSAGGVNMEQTTPAPEST